MPDSEDHPLSPLIRKLSLWSPLDAEDRAAILALPHVRREIAANQYLVWDGDRPTTTCLLLCGFAFRQQFVLPQ